MMDDSCHLVPLHKAFRKEKSYWLKENNIKSDPTETTELLQYVQHFKRSNRMYDMDQVHNGHGSQVYHHTTASIIQ